MPRSHSFLPVVLSLVCFLSVGVVVWAQSTAPQEEVETSTDIQSWIEQLGADEYEDREAASAALRRELKSDPKGVASLLEGALESDDPEVRQRVRGLLSATAASDAPAIGGEVGPRRPGPDVSIDVEDLRAQFQKTLESKLRTRGRITVVPPLPRFSFEDEMERMQKEIEEVHKRLQLQLEDAQLRFRAPLRRLPRALGKSRLGGRAFEGHGFERLKELLGEDFFDSGDFLDSEKGFSGGMKFDFDSDFFKGLEFNGHDEEKNGSFGRVQIWQNGKKILDKSFGDTDHQPSGDAEESDAEAKANLQVRSLPAAFKLHFDVDHGLLVEGSRGLTLKKGDVILSANGQAITNVIDLIEAVREPKAAKSEATSDVRFEILRKGLKLEVSAPRSDVKQAIDKDFQTRPLRTRSRVR